MQLSDTLNVQLNTLNILMVSVKRLFPTCVQMRKFQFEAIEWYSLVLFIMRDNSLLADIIHQGLTWIICGF